jgi:cell wall-associated NlpC family hydrolase
MFDPTPYLKGCYLPNGRRWPEIDCWGLVCAVFAGERGIVLDPYDTTSCGDAPGFAAAVAAESRVWTEVPLDQLRTLDVLLFRNLGRPTHVGVIIEPPRFLHAREGAGICVVSLLDRKQPWRTKRVFAAFRHPLLA